MRRLIKKTSQLLGIGQLSESLRTQIDAEGVLPLLEEGIPVTAILQGFKAPGIRCGYRRMSFIGFVVLTNRRLIVSASFHHKVCVDVAYEDARFRTITFDVIRKRLSMSFEAAGLIPDASGDVTLNLGVADAATAARILREKGAIGFGEPGAPPNDGPATRLGNSGATEGPPSVS